MFTQLLGKLLIFFSFPCFKEFGLMVKQGPGAEQFFDTPAPAPLLFNKLWFWPQLQICSCNFTFQFEILIHNIYYKKGTLIK